jgi:hypothetical protein
MTVGTENEVIEAVKQGTGGVFDGMIENKKVSWVAVNGVINVRK